MRQPRFSEEQKRAAVDLSHSDIPLKDAAKRSGCSLASLMNWRRASKQWVDRKGASAKPENTPVPVVHSAAPNTTEVDHEIIILQFLIKQLLEKLPQVLKSLDERI